MSSKSNDAVSSSDVTSVISVKKQPELDCPRAADDRWGRDGPREDESTDDSSSDDDDSLDGFDVVTIDRAAEESYDQQKKSSLVPKVPDNSAVEAEEAAQAARDKIQGTISYFFSYLL